MKECPKELIDAHWGYVEQMLKTHGVGPDSLKLVEFHYRTSGAHFWKHAKEDSDQLINKLKEEIAELQRQPRAW